MHSVPGFDHCVTVSAYVTQPVMHYVCIAIRTKSQFTIIEFSQSKPVLVSFPDLSSSVNIDSSIILKAIRTGVGWVWSRD